MAMPVNFTDVIEFTLIADALDQQILNVLHYFFNPTPTGSAADTDLQVIGPAILAAWVAQIPPQLSSEYHLTDYRAVQLTTLAAKIAGPPRRVQWTKGIKLEETLIVPVTGGIAGNSGTTFEAAGIKKQCARAGRGFRGGARVGPLAETSYIENTLDGLYLPNLQTAATTWVSAAIPSGNGVDVLKLCVLSGWDAYLHGAVGNQANLFATLVTGAAVNPFVTSQVSRKRKNRFF